MFTRTIVLGGLSLLIASAAYAGDVTAKASQNFARVQINTCNMMNPDQCPVVFDGPMSAGQTYRSDTGRLCYKRENYPGNAQSGMEASWNCHSNPSDSPETSSID